MSISARLATGTILLLALAGCTENRMMDGSSPARPPDPLGPAAARVWAPIRSCVRPAASSRNACVPAPILTTDP